ncbi:glutamyl-tRNA reductase [Desulfonatronospira sp.]|uniref:glutamyl-tRNA reductase n=1 Tax=Desulfonatronospira sp. TaxID=1962951 RepID=UPI0025BF025B|nr:glutamyl-tRNA reductase [Desulfonatronospira sp.]
MEQKIHLFGLSHKTAEVEIREKFALTGFNPVTVELVSRDGPVSEALVLSTCNRVEILCVGTLDDEQIRSRVLAAWASFCNADPDLLGRHIYHYTHREAVKHLFSVAASLDSMVLGEPQILGQLKDAYRKAVNERSTGVIINRMLHKSFSSAKRTRSETAVSSSAVSISYAAVELAKKIFGELDTHRAMLIGAGEMAELAALHLLNQGLKEIMVANRTLERAQELARKFGGRPLCLEDIFEYLPQADIIISSTGSASAIIRARDIRDVLKKRKHRPMFFIDIAVPRDIDPDVNQLDNVYLYDIDDLQEVVEENLAGRRDEARKAEEIVEQEVDKFEKWLSSLDLSPTIVDLLNKGENIARREVRKSLRNLPPDSDEKTVQTMEHLAESLVGKLYHEPIVFLKRRAMEEGSSEKYIDLARKIFNLDEEQIPDNPHAEKKRK